MAVWVTTHNIAVVLMWYVLFLLLKSWRSKAIYVGFVVYKMALGEELPCLMNSPPGLLVLL
jgi:hypothetical protein